MPAGMLVLGDVEITAICDVDTVMPLAEAFDRGDPPPGGIDLRIRGLSQLTEHDLVSGGVRRRYCAESTSALVEPDLHR